MPSEQEIKCQIEQYVERLGGYIEALARINQNPIASADDLYGEGLLAIVNLANENYEKFQNEIYVKSCIRNAIVSYALSNAGVTTIPPSTIFDILHNKTSASEIKDTRKYRYILPNDAVYDPSFNECDKVTIRDIVDRYDRNGMARMVLLKGYSYKEAAKYSGVRPKTVYMRVKLIRDIIRNKCKQEKI